MKKLLQTLLAKTGYKLSRTSLEQKRRWLSGQGFGTILDIGANDGDSVAEFQRLFAGGTIHSFEPLPEVYARLRERARQTPGPCRVVLHNFGFSDRGGKAQFNLNEYSASSSLMELGSLHQERFPFARTTRKVEVRMRRLDDWAAGQDFEGEIFAKIDVQGAEMLVIRGGQDFLRRVRMLVIELSFAELYEGEPHFDEVHAALKALGFRYAGSWEQTHDPASGQPLFQDAVFVR